MPLPRGSPAGGALTTVLTITEPICWKEWMRESDIHTCLALGIPRILNVASKIANGDASGEAYYSPAICPSGFEVKYHDTTAWDTVLSDQLPSIAPMETVGMCCRSDYEYANPSAPEFSDEVLLCAKRTGDSYNIWPALQIRWQSSDLSILETHPLTPGLSLAEVTTTEDFENEAVTHTVFKTAPAESSIVATVDTTSENSKPSKAVRYGIGFGIAFGILFFGIAIFLFFRRRQSRSQEQPMSFENHIQPSHKAPEILELEAQTFTRPIAELGVERVSELSAEPRIIVQGRGAV